MALGGGRARGTAQRYRGLFVPQAREINVNTRNISATLALTQISREDQPQEQLEVDRDGLRLEDLRLRPWQTVVVREEGLESIAGGIALVRVSNLETTIVNKTGKDLLGVIFGQPGGDVMFSERIAAGDSISSTTMSGTPPYLLNRTAIPHGLHLHEIGFYTLQDELNEASPGLHDAWEAVTHTTMDQRDWFPTDVPVLLAEVDDPDGPDSDSGLKLEQHRMLVRVVGYGGTP